jgi:hypothetical protein
MLLLMFSIDLVALAGLDFNVSYLQQQQPPATSMSPVDPMSVDPIHATVRTTMLPENNIVDLDVLASDAKRSSRTGSGVEKKSLNELQREQSSHVQQAMQQQQLLLQQQQLHVQQQQMMGMQGMPVQFMQHQQYMHGSMQPMPTQGAYAAPPQKPNGPNAAAFAFPQ